MNKVLMKCGHTANAKTGDKPCCAICAGTTADAFIVADKVVDLTGRKAVCNYCNRTTDSNINLPFFEHQPNEQNDKYYDGCFGWD